jgi:putative flippase GtrA
VSLTQEAETAFGPVDRILRQAVVRQFIKFAVIGFVSTAIHWIVYGVLVHRGMHRQLAYAIGFGLAVTNGFFGNRLWTFRGEHRRAQHSQYLMFVLVNLVGLGIGSAIVELTFHLFRRWGYPASLAQMAGLPISTPAITIWNFLANRYWTFAATDPGTSE